MLKETESGTADDGERGVVKLLGELRADVLGSLGSFSVYVCC